MGLTTRFNPKDGWWGSYEWEEGDADLDPCPFCGAAAVEMAATNVRSYWVECGECGADGPNSRYGAEDDVVPDSFDSEASCRLAHETSMARAVGHWNARAERRE